MDIKTAMALNYEFFAAICGFHIHRQVWQPEQDVTLVCSHEADNPFNLFSIKVTNRHGVLSGHSPREISRPTKYLLDQGASVTATLTDVKYRRSPLFQGGLEIPCKVKVEMPSTVLTSKLIGRYREMVLRLYAVACNCGFLLGERTNAALRSAYSSATTRKQRKEGKSFRKQSSEERTRYLFVYVARTIWR